MGWKIFKQLIRSRTLVSRYKIIQQVLHISCEEFLIFDLNGAFCVHVNRFNEQLEEQTKKISKRTCIHKTLHPLQESTQFEFIVFMFFCTL